MAGFAARPGHAAVYKFVIPTTTIQDALRDSILASQTPSPDPNAFAFYDLYLRPALNTEPGPGSVIADSTYNGAISPIPSGEDQWDTSYGMVSIGSFVIDPFLSVRFTFNPLDSKLALVTTNPNIDTSQEIDGMNPERMPGDNEFQILVNSPTSLAAEEVRLKVFGFAYQFEDNTWSSVIQKGTIFDATFSAVGQEAPEPGSWAMLCGGALLLAVVVRRRKLAPSPHIS